MGQHLPCFGHRPLPNPELVLNAFVTSSPIASSHLCSHIADKKKTKKTGGNSLGGRVSWKDVEAPANAPVSSRSQTFGSTRDGYSWQSDCPLEEMKVGSVHEVRGSLGIESETAVSRKCSLTSYSLAEDEIEHRRLNPHVPVCGNFCSPSLRKSQTNGILNSTERWNRESLRTGMPQRRAERSSPRAPRVSYSSQQRRDSGMFGRPSSRNSTPAEGDLQSQSNQPIGFRVSRPGNQPSVSIFVRFTNSNPFAQNDSFLSGLPGFSFNRGFDNDGFFFFTLNMSHQGSDRQRPTHATKEQIEKAVSQLKGLTSDLKIKKGDTCPICLDQLRTTDDVVEMPCPCKRTFFHRKCAVDTLEKTKKIKCPNCRRWEGNNTGQ